MNLAEGLEDSTTEDVIQVISPDSQIQHFPLSYSNRLNELFDRDSLNSLTQNTHYNHFSEQINGNDETMQPERLRSEGEIAPDPSIHNFPFYTYGTNTHSILQNLRIRERPNPNRNSYSQQRLVRGLTRPNNRNLHRNERQNRTVPRHFVNKFKVLQSKTKKLEDEAKIPLSKKIEKIEKRNSSLKNSLKAEFNKKVHEKAVEVKNEIRELCFCMICFSPYNSVFKKKMKLKCGHFACGPCLLKISKVSDRNKCHICNKFYGRKQTLWVEDKNFEKDKKILFDTVQDINRFIEEYKKESVEISLNRKRKRELGNEPLQPPKKKIKLVKFYKEITSRSYECLICGRFRKSKKMILSHWWNTHRENEYDVEIVESISK